MYHKGFPTARIEGLIVEELDDEVLVYDTDRDRAHCLNSTAAVVWKLCDGRKSAHDIARQLHRRISSYNIKDSGRIDRAQSIEATEALVWLALSQLNRDHLLTDGFAPPRVPPISRREALLRVGIGAAIAVPIIVSITAPMAVQAGSCKPSGANCGTSSQCCSGLCSGGNCT